jgi:hypothetical protein
MIPISDTSGLYTGSTVEAALDQIGFDGARVSKVYESDFGAVALQADATGNIGIGTATPDYSLQVGDGAASVALSAGENIVFIGPDTASGRLILEGTAQADIILIDGGGGADDKAMQLFTEGGLTKFRSFTDAAAVQSDNIIVMDHSGGDVGIGTAGPDARLDVLDTGGPQLRLTFQDGVKFADFEVDTNHDLTIKPSSTGQIIFQPTADSTDFFQVLDANGGTPIINIDSVNERQGIGTATPFQNVAGGATDLSSTGIHIKNSSTVVRFILEGNPPAFNLIDLGGAADDKVISVAVDNGIIRWLSSNDDLTTNQDNILVMDLGTGNVGFGVASPQGQIHAYNSISGFIIWEYDGLDATVRTVIPNGTGDVLYRLRATYVMRDSAAAVAGATANVNNGASTNLTVGTNTVRLRVNADGSCDVARTAGTDTIKIALMLNWL